MTDTPDPDDVDSIEAETELRFQGEREGLSSSLHDTDEEQGDEAEINDSFDMDDKEAKELDAELDDRDEPEPGLN